jgi:hypothetical protein
LSSGANINLTKPDKYVTILIKAYCKNGRRFKSSSRDGGEQYEYDGSILFT